LLVVLKAQGRLAASKRDGCQPPRALATLKLRKSERHGFPLEMGDANTTLRGMRA
jgi:hypothetical protein